MLFNSFEYIFLFLPVVAVIFYVIGARGHHRVAIAWLVAASLFFYSWWNPAYTGLILFSMLFNYGIGVQLNSRDGLNSFTRKAFMVFGVSANLALLGYYKYANFFVDNMNAAFGADFHLETIILPLAISFFTFQQVAYLVDTYRGLTREYSFLHYALFVVFFPQLIAGPIVHHKEMMPQFLKESTYRASYTNISLGLVFFAIGLFKKVVIADNMALYASPVFSDALNNAAISFFDAWIGALAYTFQLYFDFSGYADMAIGSALFFGIQLPQNFNSPYKSTNISAFWRRWHMTLGRFLRDYIYIPLGGSRCSRHRQAGNLMTTMLLGGLWHGAGWTFIFWGGLHGIYLIVNHAWSVLSTKWFGTTEGRQTRLGTYAATLFTFLAVVIGWVFFRAESFDSALHILKGMTGMNGVELPIGLLSAVPGLNDMAMHLGWTGVSENAKEFVKGWLLTGAVTILLFGPNSHQIADYLSNVEYQDKLRVRYAPVLLAILALVSVLSLTKHSEFLYFQF